MKKVILRLDCGIGMHSADSYLVSEEDWAIYKSATNILAEDFLAQVAWDEAVQFAESYGIYPESDRLEEFDEEQESYGRDEYSDAIEGWFEEYNPDEHDGLIIGSQTEWHWREI